MGIGGSRRFAFPIPANSSDRFQKSKHIYIGASCSAGGLAARPNRQTGPGLLAFHEAVMPEGITLSAFRRSNYQENPYENENRLAVPALPGNGSASGAEHGANIRAKNLG